MKVIIENIRTFSGYHEIPIRPLTILTGENSSGKSTLLTVLAALSDKVKFPTRPPFNSPPYNLGTYDTIASKFGASPCFSMGWVSEDRKINPDKEIATYVKLDGDLSISKYELFTKSLKIVYEQSLEQQTRLVKLFSHDGKRKWKAELDNHFKFDFPYGFRQELMFTLLHSNVKQIDRLREAFEGEIFDPFLRESLSIAPIRSRPERIYDRTLETKGPDGSHVPFTIARVLAEKNPARRNKLTKLLLAFGEESGLFKLIDVRPLGKRPSDPFQLRANVSGRRINLTDVGYGVSQSLPIVIESVLANARQRILVQQPEVHLHPRAQAALGTFFAQMAVHDERHFVIETHSDFIVDRIRQEVAAGEIPSEKVLILYFERKGPNTQVWPITISSNGDVVDTPPSYRNFFAREAISLLRRTK